MVNQILLYNAKVYLYPGEFAEAVLIRGSRISAVGTRADLSDSTDVSCHEIDCGGRTIVPGFNDSHMHLMEFGENMRQAPVHKAESVEDIIRICTAFAEENPEAVRHGLHSAGWNQDHFPDHRIPDRKDLDRISTDYPIVLERVCGHIACANTAAIRMLGLTAESPQYPDGRFFFGEDGEPNGIFAGNACLYVRKLIPEFTPDEKLDILEESMKYAVSKGLTSVQSNDVGAMSGTSEDNFALFQRLYDEGCGLIRYRHQVNFETLDDFRRCIESGEYAKAGNAVIASPSKDHLDPPLLTLGPLKLYKDGSLGARTAYLKDGYLKDPENHGLQWQSQEDLLAFCRLAAKNGIQVVTHCIGDAAIEQVADCYIQCNAEFNASKNPLRHGLVHCQITDRDLLRKIADNDLLTLVQPVFLNADIPILKDLIRPELAASSYAFGPLIHSCGNRVSLGTDCPVEDCDPFQNIYSAVTRKRLSTNASNDSFHPEECLTVEEAVDAYTIGSAYAMFMEHELGRIHPGFLADLVLLDTDIFTCPVEDIKKTRPLLTMVSGNVVYSALEE